MVYYLFIFLIVRWVLNEGKLFTFMSAEVEHVINFKSFSVQKTILIFVLVTVLKKILK